MSATHDHGAAAALLQQRNRDGALAAQPHWNDTIATILNHRSVRGFLPGALPEGTLELLIAAAQSASTSSNLQVWSVVAVFGMAVGHPDPAKETGIKPRLPQDVVLHHEQYDAALKRDAIERYNGVARDFMREQGMKKQDRTLQATNRLKDVPAMHGRDRMKEALLNLGFELRYPWRSTLRDLCHVGGRIGRRLAERYRHPARGGQSGGKIFDGAAILPTQAWRAIPYPSASLSNIRTATSAPSKATPICWVSARR
jgi:hypothetical protein